MVQRITRAALLTAAGLLLAWLEHLFIPSIAVPLKVMVG